MSCLKLMIWLAAIIFAIGLYLIITANCSKCTDETKGCNYQCVCRCRQIRNVGWLLMAGAASYMVYKYFTRRSRKAQMCNPLKNDCSECNEFDRYGYKQHLNETCLDLAGYQCEKCSEGHSNLAARGVEPARNKYFAKKYANTANVAGEIRAKKYMKFPVVPTHEPR